MGDLKTRQPSQYPASDDRPLIIFDGVCHLCNASVAFIIRRDPRGVFRFTPLQGDHAKNLLRGVPAQVINTDSVLLMENGRIYDRSEAALRICRRLPWPWNLLWALRIIPKGFVDSVYALVARNRYRWFGRREACMMPRAEWKDRFV